MAASGQSRPSATLDVRSIVSVPLPGPDGPMGAVSFAESSFFPVPPEVMLAPMCLAHRGLDENVQFRAGQTEVGGARHRGGSKAAATRKQG